MMGMTLLEVMIVVVLLAVVAAVVVPAIGKNEQTLLASAARQLMADLDFARVESIAHADEPRGLKFDPATETYSVVKDAATPFDCASASAITNPADGQPYTTQFGAGRASTLAGVGVDSVSLDGDMCIAFGSFGETDQASDATITLVAHGKTLTLTIDPVSGETTTD